MGKKEELMELRQFLDKAVITPNMRMEDLLAISHKIDLLVNDMMRELHSDNWEERYKK